MDLVRTVGEAHRAHRGVVARQPRFIGNAGAAGVSDDAGLARDYASMRTMRLADGPDEVHNRAIARLELRKYANATH